MRRSRTSRGWGSAVVVLLALASCSHFEAADHARSSTSEPAGAPAPKGSEAAGPSSTPAPARAETGSTAPAPTTPSTTSPPASAPSAAPRNVASAVTDGLEVEVVAEHGPDYASRPRFRIQVTLRNRSDQVRHYFLGQGNYAVLTDEADEVVWASGECNPTLEAYEIHGGAAPLGPGEEVSAIVDHPQPPVGNDAGCDLPDGRYHLVGMFPVCPPEHVEETGNPGTYACPEESVQMYVSAGLAITIGGPR